MSRSSPHPDPAARLVALLGSPLGAPLPGGADPPGRRWPPAIPPPGTERGGRPDKLPLPAVFRPAIPPGTDAPTLPLVLPSPRPMPGWEPPGLAAPALRHADMEEDAPGDPGHTPDPGDDLGSDLGGDLAGDDPEPPARHLPGARPGRSTRLAERWLPARWRGARLDPGRAGAIALVLVAAVAATVAAVGVWSARPRAEQIPALPAVSLTDPAATPQPDRSAQPGAQAPVELVVAVSGKVRRPGLVRVPDGARVADVLEAAGGPLPGTDLSTLNLARRVADGEQVAVGVPAAADAGTPAAPTGGGSSPGSGGKVDLNRATLEQLDTLPGIGPVTAQRILDRRTRSGPFVRLEQLREVEGIGERRFAQLRDLVTV